MAAFPAEIHTIQAIGAFIAAGADPLCAISANLAVCAVGFGTGDADLAALHADGHAASGTSAAHIAEQITGAVGALSTVGANFHLCAALTPETGITQCFAGITDLVAAYTEVCTVHTCAALCAAFFTGAVAALITDGTEFVCTVYALSASFAFGRAFFTEQLTFTAERTGAALAASADAACCLATTAFIALSALIAEPLNTITAEIALAAQILAVAAAILGGA